MRVTRDDITPALAGLLRGLNSPAPMQGALNAAKIAITMRTLSGESLRGGVFPGYSTDTYYAPVAGRPAGYPSPSGGRRTAKRGGRRLKSMAFDEPGGYGAYKAGIGRGASPQLSVSGALLDAIVGTVESPRRGVLSFASAHAAAKAAGHHTGKYPWFGLQERERPKLYAAIAAVLRRIRGVEGRG